MIKEIKNKRSKIIFSIDNTLLYEHLATHVEEFEARCIAEAKKYKTKKETFIENILNSSRWEFAEILVTIEYGKRPRR